MMEIMVLIVSSWKNNQKIMKLLIENDINMEQKNNIGKTAIDYSVENGISMDDIEEIYGKKTNYFE